MHAAVTDGCLQIRLTGGVYDDLTAAPGKSPFSAVSNTQRAFSLPATQSVTYQDIMIIITVSETSLGLRWCTRDTGNTAEFPGSVHR